MKLLPSCAYYIRRTLKKIAGLYSMPDLLQSIEGREYGLEGRLRYLYPNHYERVILQLEQLIYSHQHAQICKDEMALQEITDRILWWLGYGIDSCTANAKIFVVDDSIEILKLITTLLGKAGYETATALSGQLALTKIPAAKPSLILLDINLPDLDGYQVYQKLRALPETADIPIVFLSGVEDVHTIQNQNKTHTAYLSKPFSPHSLLSCVKHHVEACSSSNVLTSEVLSYELSTRRQQAQRLMSVSEGDRSQGAGSHHDETKGETKDEAKSAYFFRATLDGRYLRVSEAFARLCGYESTEDIVSNVTNLWDQVYEDTTHEDQWRTCLQHPNQLKVLSTKVKTKQNHTLDVVEEVSLVQDDYSHNLFYHGYVFI